MFFLFFPNHLQMSDPVLADFERGLALVRRKYPLMTVGALETLVHIARSQHRILTESLSLKDVAKEIDARYSTLTRHSDVLGAGVGGRGGLDLLEKVRSGGDQKCRRIELSQAGIDFLSELIATLKDATN